MKKVYMLFTKEFYEMMDSFEKVSKELISVGSSGFKREDKESFEKRRYYSDGAVNEAFIVFMHGYALAKNVYQNSLEDQTSISPQQHADIDEKRFYAACAAMQGFVTRCAGNPEDRAFWSVQNADALIKELKRTGPDAEKGGDG